ncbi:uroporphyrinogen-III synthase [Dickeya poaceiphila]|uniref:Uroporphyrinogen-III synthase n=1 Tax=Dickeya poaceiphila TaxID=568768 RepID=A0A5B8I656_9GAMM|nr:uroporphyrinogen-III synthase [Dickeya poaceiphila]QDX28640.1 uroporphyrinogen-III synthase [Dickeya poaceiphila]
MTILVTRPSPAGEQLVARLRMAGLQAYHSPLIEFSPGSELPQLPSMLQALHPSDVVLALSQQVVEFADPVLSRAGMEWPTSLSYFAVGRATGLALHTVSGLSVHYPPERATSETLLQLPALQQVAGKQALLLRGNGGRELLGDTLQRRGAQVRYCECYQRTPVIYDGVEQCQRWQHLGIDTLVITSGEMLQQLYKLVPDYYRTTWLTGCRVVVVSERLAGVARELGWHDIQIADNADNDALMRALQ